MKLILSVTEGPHQGREFTFDGHDTFLVGRVKDAHLQLSYDDPYFSRRHFVLEINPPRCRLMDLKSRNGTYLNGERVDVADVKHGDRIKAGHTLFEVRVQADGPERQVTVAYSMTGGGQEPPRPAGDPVIWGYEIVKELGRGGMGVVYQAKRRLDGKMAAVKTITVGDGTPQKHIERFVREAEILGKVKHPNVVGFYEQRRFGNVIHLAMELLTGPDAERLLADGGPMEIRTAVRLTCQVLAGLAHAHGLGYVHRDIKPANILIHAEGGKKVAKLADFGLARAYETSRVSGVTMQGEVGGTAKYMAPEQVTHYREVKPAADQYSAAATLYTLLTGRCVHDLPPGLPQQLVHITTAEVVPIRRRRADVPEGLADVIHRALRREPEERWPDVAALRSELKRWA